MVVKILGPWASSETLLTRSKSGSNLEPLGKLSGNKKERLAG
jgi:hypothetical protein